MPILAIDPGTTRSAYVVFDDGLILDHGILPNGEMLDRIHEWSEPVDHHTVAYTASCPSLLPEVLAIEMIASYGMAVGKEVFETCVWIGRFIEAFQGDYAMVYRKDIKLFLCGTTKAKDPNIRQALIDRYGGSKEAAVGTKHFPGPLYGIKADEWAALAVAVTFEGKPNGK